MTRMKGRTLKRNFEHRCMTLMMGVFVAAFALPASANPVDPVLEWNAIMNETVLTAGTSWRARSAYAPPMICEKKSALLSIGG